MSTNLINNCRRCNRVFRKAVRDICQDCIDQEQSQFKNVYKVLNESEATGGITMAELAQRAGVAQDTIEQMIRGQGFGTAINFLKIPCMNCGAMLMASQRRGKYCEGCSVEFAREAGISLRSDKDKIREELNEELPKEKQYGFRRHRI